jgi:outer membrane translocation and assembly module TamA
VPQLGGDQLLRGYYGGRFRDQDLLALQAEYRMPVWWRLGAVGFVAAGQVAPKLDDLGLDRFKPAAGLGLRFLLSPEEGLNIRADYGWGFDVESSGFYLSIGEIF